ncbi:hypothetical protein MYX76_15610 [Desulfobacterota bacterium AH_259_B03_O07]|nr:hypothetical protein [Desulfobacterota bacterium AH_259_B03_O07]
MSMKQENVNSEILAVCLSRKLKTVLHRVHWELQKSRSEIVRDAMVDYFKKKKLSDETKEMLKVVR